MLENGQASTDDIDNAMKPGCGYPMGPFTLLDSELVPLLLLVPRHW